MLLNEIKLFELSSVIKKDGFSLLQTALNFENPENMTTKGMACLLNVVAEVIRQQTGESISRMKYLDSLDALDTTKKNYNYTPMKYHDVDSLIKELTTNGVELFRSGSNGKQKFSIKLHPTKSVNDIKHAINAGYSVMLAYEACELINDFEEVVQHGSYDDLIAEIGASTLASKEKFNEWHKKFKSSKKYRDDHEDLFTSDWIIEELLNKKTSESEFIRATLRGIVPVISDDLGSYSAYHGVLIVGFDDAEDVFIVKEIRQKYALKGFLKIPYEYFDLFFKGNTENTFVRGIAAVEAEKA